MWHPDQSYGAEQARRAELYAEAELWRAAQAGEMRTGFFAWIGRHMVRLWAELRTAALAR